jgi:hypothetical protein
MNKIRTINHAQDFLDKEFSWRLKEISNLNTTIKKTKFPQQRSLIRAGIPILYAHWEGFIKTSTEAYINYVSNQKEKYKDLEYCFIVRGLKNKINLLSDSNKFSKNIEIVDFILDKLESTASIPYRGVVHTNSNLSSEIFKEIAFSVGIDTSHYETRYKFIDERILRKRNQIAHGEFMGIDKDSYDELSKGIINLLRQYKTDIENSLLLKAFIR